MSFGILPILAGSFVESLYARPEYSGSLSLPAGCAHVCIMGAVHPGMLNQLLNDFSSSSVQGEDRHPDSIYSSDETSQYMVEPVKLSRSGHPVFNTMIVLLSPGPPSQELKKILFSPEAHTRRAVYFTGSCKVVQDLERVKADQALAILVLSDEKTSSLREEEVH